MKERFFDDLGYSMTERGFFVDEDGGYVSVERMDGFPNPLDEWSTVATYLTWERDSLSPSPNPYESPEEFFDTFFEEPETGLTMEEMAAEIAKADGGICEPVFRGVDDRIGLSDMPFATTRPWCVGFAYVSADDLAAENTTAEQVVENIKEELSCYSAWNLGDVWRVAEHDAEIGVEKEGAVWFYGLDALEAAHPSLEPAPPLVSAALKGAPFVDARGMVVLESFQRKDGLSDVLAFSPAEKEYVVARGYDEATSACSLEERFSDPMRAWAAANPEIIEKSLVVWEKEDVRSLLKDLGLKPDDHAVDATIRAASSMSDWRDRAIEDGHEQLSDAAAAATASRIVSRIRPKDAKVVSVDLIGAKAPSRRDGAR